MARYRSSRTLPTILTIVVIIIAIVGLVSIARFLFFPGTPAQQQVADTSRQDLLSSEAGRAVTMVVRGPIVADENFRSYQITVSPSSRDLKTYSGYLDTVIEQRNLPNNVTAYEQFVHALDKANLVVGQPFSGEQNDVRGICATGRVYEFALVNNGEATENLWTSTCEGSTGSLQANVKQLQNLFILQIPNNSEIVRDLGVGRN